MPVTFDYDTWDSTTESIPRRGGATSRDVTRPFNPNLLMDALLSETVPIVGQELRKEFVSTLQSVLWITLSRFRQMGMSAGDLQRLVKAYPSRGKKQEQRVLDTALISHNRISNPNNWVIDTHPDDQYEIRLDATGKVWTKHPKP